MTATTWRRCWGGWCGPPSASPAPSKWPPGRLPSARRESRRPLLASRPSLTGLVLAGYCAAMASPNRRPPGAGTVEHRRDGRWQVRVRIGQRRPSIGTYATEAEAEGVLAAALEAMAQAPEPSTLGAYGPAWLDRRSRDGYRNAGTDASRWSVHVAPDPIARLDLHGVTGRDVAELLGRVASRGAARESVRHVRTLLGALYRDAVRRGDAAASPVVGVELPRRGRPPREWTYLTLDEIAAVEAVRPWVPRRYEHPTDEARQAVLLAVYTGLRQGEQYGLEWADVTGIDGDRPMMTIRRSWRGETKTGAVRTIPILPPAAAILRALPRRGPTVHATPSGRPYTRGYDARWGEGMRERLGVSRAVRWHDLRHTCASHLVSGSWGRAWRLEEVREYLGHTSIEVTQRYAHLAPEALRATAAATVGPARASSEVDASSGANRSNYLRTHVDLNHRPSAPEAGPGAGDIAGDSGSMRPSCVQLAADVLRLAARQDPLALSRAIDLAAAVLDEAAAVAPRSSHAS